MDDLDFLDVDTTPTPEVNQLTQRSVMQNYINFGYGLFAVDGKIPKVKNWQDTKASESQPFDRGNYGINLRDEDLIVDIDPRNGGDESYIKLLTDLKIDSPTTYTVATGGGGLHLYLRKPPGVQIRKKLSNYKGIEFLSKGCYVVGPWSIHPVTRQPYTIGALGLDKIEQAPNELLNVLRTEKKMVVKKSVEHIQEWNRFVSYLENCIVAIQGDGGDETTYKVACYGKDLGLPEDQTLTCMLEHWNERCEPPWSPEELQIKVANAYRYGVQRMGELSARNSFDVVEEHDATLFQKTEWKTDKNGMTIKNSLNNVVMYLLTTPELKNLIRYNEFTQDIEFTRIAPWHHNGYRRYWSDSDDTFLQYYLENKLNYQAQETTVIKAVQAVAEVRRYHPVKQWLESAVWDGVPRIDTWLTKYLGVDDNEYTREVGRLVLYGAIHRIYSPGCKFDYVLVLEGKTGIGKSTAIEILGGNWYSSGTIDFHNKDTVDLLRGKWIIEMAEMDVMSKSEVSAAKAFITRQVDRARLAFTRRTKDFPRQCIFIGTINPNGTGYLKDDTGNRRYWPILCKAEEGKPMMNLKELKNDVEQLWAEAVQRCKNNEAHLYMKNVEVAKMAEEEQELRRPMDEWVGAIIHWAIDNDIQETSPLKIWVEALGGSPNKFGKLEQMRLASILKADLKWEQVQRRVGGVQTRVYKRSPFLD